MATGIPARALTTFGLVLASAFVAACATGSRPGGTGAPTTASAPPGAELDGGGGARSTGEMGCPDRPGLCFSVVPEDTEIFLNGAGRGRIADLKGRGAFLPLAPGIYRITLQRPGYATWRAEVAVRAVPERIVVSLRPRS